jgi:hypothetical protein
MPGAGTVATEIIAERLKNFDWLCADPGRSMSGDRRDRRAGSGWNHHARWFRGGMAAFAVLVASIATATLVHASIDRSMPMVAAIASIAGIGALLRWAVLRERANQELREEEKPPSDGKNTKGRP